MAQIQAETLDPAATGMRSAGTPDLAGPADADADGPEVLSAEDLRVIGATIGGTPHWQADIARIVGYSKSNMTRYLNGSRKTNPLLGRQIRKLMLTKIAALTRLLATPGLPGSDDPDTVAAQAMITKALKLLDHKPS